MTIKLTKLRDLNEAQLIEVRALVQGQNDFTFEWEIDTAFQHVRIADRSGKVVGLCGWNGSLTSAQPFVWVHPEQRGEGAGTEMVDCLAVEMSSRGVRGLGQITIASTGGEADAARKLLKRFRDRVEAWRTPGGSHDSEALSGK